MYIKNRIPYFMLLIVLGGILSFSSGCSQEEEPLIVYAGKGLKNAMDEIKQSFEQQVGIPVSIIYAGSNSLLTTLKNTRKGDVFIPGSQSYIKKAGKLANASQYVAHHVPAFIVQADSPKALRTYTDLLAPGVRIAVGNKDMCAIGKVGEAILSEAAPQQTFRSNIVITGSTVNELLNLVVDKEVDAALVWADMLEWKKAKDLVLIVIPDNINKYKEIRVSTLSVSTQPKQALLFANFVATATEGRAIFLKHGFSEK